MNSIRQQLDLLLQQTEENISKEKDYRFSIQKGIPDKLKKEYYKNYLLKSIDKNAVRTVFETTTDRYGNSKEVKVTYEAMPVHHYNTILAMAFYKAREFYGNVRSKTQAKSKEVYKTFDLPIENTGDDENEISSLSAVECLMLSRQIKQGKTVLW